MNIKHEIKQTVEMIEMKMIASIDSNLNCEIIYSDEITKLVKKIQEDKSCMPDNINSKEEHAQYLKDIGHAKHVEKLQHYYDTTVGLYATDKPELINDPEKLLFELI